MSLRGVAKPKSEVHWLSVLQFGGSALGLGFFWLAGLGLFTLAAYQLVANNNGSDAPSLLLTSLGMFWAGMLLAPSVATSLARLMHKPVPRLKFLRTPTKAAINLGMLVLVLVIMAGQYLTDNNLSLLLAPLHVLGATLSAALLLWTAVRNLDLGGLQRRWGAFAAGLTVGPLLATILEFLAGFIVLLVALVYIGLNQKLANNFENFMQSLQSLNNDPQTILPALQQFISDPILAGLLLANFSLVVPMIEELAKPIAVWILMWRRPLTPAQGFGLGAISGAGFAIAENLFSGAAVPGWAETTFVRIGATAFHIATAGLMGWALVRARGEKKILIVPAIYVFNIAIHGLWNGVVISGAFLPVPPEFSVFSGIVLLGITLLAIGILFFMNRRLQPTAPVTVKRVKNSIRPFKPRTRS